MLELELHIIRLLLDNNCVIVPNFGGFIAHHVHAYYDTKEKAFFPPSRTVGFNPKLTMNDSLLAQSYVDTYDISYPEALNRIGESVEKIKQTIETKGAYTLNCIGTIIKVHNSQYDFRPCKVNILTPANYGLSAFEIKSLQKVDNEEVAVAAETAHVVEIAPKATPLIDIASDAASNEKSLSIRIPVNVIRQLVAVCIALVVFTLFPAPIGDSSKNSHFQSAIDTNMLYRIMPKDITKGKPDKLNNGINHKNNEVSKTIKPQSKKATVSQKMFSIVLASRVTKANAKRYVEQLHKKGMAEAEVYSHGGNTKVIYNHFATKDEASKALNKLTDNIEFAGCWITEINVDVE